MRNILRVAFFIVFPLTTNWAQQLPLFTQYVFDPYMINPSMVAHYNKPEINLLYRRQWTGIEDGPKTLQFDAQLPINTKMAVGINLYNDKTVLLSATSALLTFGYKVPLAKDHTLGFGLSGGIFSNHFNLDEVPLIDSGDPALLNTASNNIAVNGQFGANYSFKDFTLGWSLVNLFERNTLSAEKFQEVKFSQMKNQIIFAAYRLTLVPATWFLQPNIAYRLSQDGVNYYEASAIISYKNLIDVGGGYRQDFGGTLMLRLHLKKLHVGAAYDLSSNQAQVSPGGTQELQLKWREEEDLATLNKNQKKSTIPKPEEEKLQPEQKEEKVIESAKQEVPIAPAVLIAKVEEPKVEPIKEEPIQEVPKVAVVDPPELYFVIGTFENKTLADQFMATVNKKGMEAEIKESKPGAKPYFYYVHIPKYKSKDVTFDKIVELKKITGFNDAWFTKLE